MILIVRELLGTGKRVRGRREQWEEKEWIEEGQMGLINVLLCIYRNFYN
jgi:hypothetical protein